MKGIGRAFVGALFCVCSPIETMHSSSAAESANDLPPAVARKLELVRLLKAEKFAELEQRMAALFRAIDVGGAEKNKAANDLTAFSRADPEIAGPLVRWGEAYPQSAAPHLALGLYGAQVGWTVRGEQFSRFTNRERFKEMVRYFDAAGKSLHKAVALRPKLAIAWARLINIAKVTSDHVGVAALFDEAVTHVPASSEIYWEYHDALSARWGGPIGKQIKLKLRIKLLFPGNSDFAWVDLVDQNDWAWALFRKKDYEAALALFDKLIAEGAGSICREGRALSLYRLKRPEEGIAEMQRALVADSGKGSYYAQLAWMQRYMKDQENWRAAERNYDIAISLDPYDPETLVDRADFLMAHGKAAAARQDLDLDRALFFGAYDDGVRDGRRLYFLSIGDIEPALGEAKKMVTLVPANPFNHYAYGATLFADRDCTAREYLERYVDLCGINSDMCRHSDMTGTEMMLNAMVELCN